MKGLTWITGGSSGLGAALALRVARAGGQVAISARNAKSLAEVAAQAPSGQVHAYPLDITDPEQTESVVARIERDHGPIAQALLNAGTHKPVTPAHFDRKTFEDLTAINLMGTVNCLGALVPRMIARKQGRLAVVASLAGYRGLPTSSAYGMTKAGLINMAEALRVELAPFGIIVQLVNPGFVRTPLTDKNTFTMPFLMELDDAADAFFRGLQSDRFEIVFPRRFAYIMKVLRLLPAPLAFAVTRRLVPGDGSGE